MLIRVILLSMLALVAYYAFLKRRVVPVHIVLVLALLGAAAGMVIFPEATTLVAGWVGVGRGADLVTYLIEVALLFLVLHYWTRFVVLEQHLTNVTRELALLRRRVEEQGERQLLDAPGAAEEQASARSPGRRSAP